MKANFKDRLYAVNPKRETSKWFVFGGLAICIVSGLIYLNKDKMAITFNGLGGKVVHLVESSDQDISAQAHAYTAQTPRPIRQRQPAAIRAEDVTSPMIEQWVKEDRVTEQKRQTVFNDDNYIPRGTDNIISAVSTRRTTYRQQKPKKSRFSNTHWQSWRWESYASGFRSKTKSGQFSYVETERGIDTYSVCANYKRGSFDYRDCRKAAKKWFESQCSSSFKQACLAESMIP